MKRPDPQREPQSTTPEKKSITKTHEEFVGDDAEPSLNKAEYEARKKKRPAAGSSQPPNPRNPNR